MDEDAAFARLTRDLEVAPEPAWRRPICAICGEFLRPTKGDESVMCRPCLSRFDPQAWVLHLACALTLLSAPIEDPAVAPAALRFCEIVAGYLYDSACEVNERIAALPSNRADVLEASEVNAKLVELAFNRESSTRTRVVASAAAAALEQLHFDPELDTLTRRLGRWLGTSI